jgi:hypothetical protein
MKIKIMAILKKVKKIERLTITLWNGWNVDGWRDHVHQLTAHTAYNYNYLINAK